MRDNIYDNFLVSSLKGRNFLFITVHPQGILANFGD